MALSGPRCSAQLTIASVLEKEAVGHSLLMSIELRRRPSHPPDFHYLKLWGVTCASWYFFVRDYIPPANPQDAPEAVELVGIQLLLATGNTWSRFPLRRLNDNCMRLNKEKCHFMVLGYQSINLTIQVETTRLLTAVVNDWGLQKHTNLNPILTKEFFYKRT